MMKKTRFLSVTAFAVAASVAQVGPATSKPIQVYQMKLGGADINVPDGDTFDLPGYGRFRLHGADAPESGQTCVRNDGTVLDASVEAKAALEAILATGTITCIKHDMSYGRIVAYCEVDDKDIAGLLISHGLAVLDERYTSGLYERILAVKQAEARARGLGVHACIDFELPKDYRERMKPR